MNRTHRNDLTSPQLTHLALIWPYDPRGGVIAGLLPLDETARRAAVGAGYQVVAAVSQQAPYTHVVSAGGQDYLATLVPAAALSPRVVMRGPSAAWRTLRAAAAEAIDDAGSVPSPLDVATQDAEHQEQAWESEGGARADGSHAGGASLAPPPPVLAPLVDAGVDLGGDRPMTGTITDLRPGGFGFIATDAWGTPWHLPFRRSAVDDDGFIDLYVGQRVRFDQALVPGGGRHQHAIGVVPLD